MTVSVIIAAFNAEAYLADAIESCLSQTLPPHEIIVVDDASTDGTAAVAASYGPRVKLLRATENAGVATSRNRAIAASTGEWLAFLDADDWFLPAKLALQLAAAASQPRLQLIYSAFIERGIDGQERVVEACNKARLRDILEYRCSIAICTVIVKRDVMLRLGGFDPLLQGTEDWEMWQRIARSSAPEEIGCVSEALSVYRRTPGSLSSKLRAMLEGRLHIANRPSPAHRGLSGLLLRRRVRAFIYYDIALALRQEDASDYLDMMRQSLLQWPIPCRMLGILRYKVALVMVLQRYFGWHTHQPQAARQR